MSTLYHCTLSSPLGALTLYSDGISLLRLSFSPVNDPNVSCPLLEEAQAQLTAYFNGTLSRFSLPLAPQGTPFQRRVWTELQTIPYGITISYYDLALRLDRKSVV